VTSGTAVTFLSRSFPIYPTTSTRAQVMHASIRRLSPITRPYRFHIGASFAGKKSLFGDEAAKPKRDFSPSSPIYIWREEQLNWKKANGAKTAGEDFFFIQQVRTVLCPTKAAQLINPPSQDAKQIGINLSLFLIRLSATKQIFDRVSHLG
jgi:hypothetical protein